MPNCLEGIGTHFPYLQLEVMRIGALEQWHWHALYSALAPGWGHHDHRWQHLRTQPMNHICQIGVRLDVDRLRMLQAAR